jgi:CubicO group peptidase (beta-lactamase class C family)
MRRRDFATAGAGAALAVPLRAVIAAGKFDGAVEILARAVAEKRVEGAALAIRHGKTELARAFGTARSPDARLYWASISKTVTAAALMTRFDRGEVRLEDPVVKFIPEFSEGSRPRITMQQVLTHVSGLPDQLPENASLRSRHAPLSDFVAGAIRTPLLFEPGARYSYSSMGILLCAEVARRLAGRSIHDLMAESVFRPLGMRRSSLGLGRFKPADLVRNQVDRAAPESGAGDPSARSWDWNSDYWRRLGAPWGAVHGSAPDLARFLHEFLRPTGKLLKPATTALMIRNHNPEGFTPRGLGFAVGKGAGSPGCSDRTFGHGGSSGTLAWADPATDTICVVLTTLPAAAANPHPRTQVSDLVARAVS